MKYYVVIKKNTFESVLMKWMKLEPLIQSEVSQKEKHQYSIQTVENSLRGGNTRAPYLPLEKLLQIKKHQEHFCMFLTWNNGLIKN